VLALRLAPRLLGSRPGSTWHVNEMFVSLHVARLAVRNLIGTAQPHQSFVMPPLSASL